MLFHNRKEAGHVLSKELSHFEGKKDVIVLGLARGGVVVAYEIAKELSLLLNVLTPRKIGAPSNPELALGSIMEDGEGVFNESIINILNVSKAYLTQEVGKEKLRAQQRLALYRQYAPLPDIKGCTVILVDDGVATGSTMLVSIRAMRLAQAKSVIVAIPVSSVKAYELLIEIADKVICPHVREDFVSVGMYYQYFSQTDDQEVVQLIKEANRHEY